MVEVYAQLRIQGLLVLNPDGGNVAILEYKKNKRPFLGHFSLSNRSTAINYRG